VPSNPADYHIGVLYASTSITGEEGYGLLELAVKTLLESLDGHVLWCLRYTQRTFNGVETSPSVVMFPPTSFDLVFDDEVLRSVESVWEKLSGEGNFMQFEEREGIGEDED